MELYPAIDIRHGRVVRLTQGEATRQTVYDADPRAVAERFAAAGAHWIHIVDLDRAFGEGDNGAVIEAIVRAVAGAASVQVGGGFRTLGRVREGLALGAARLVLGTAAVTDPALVPAAVEAVGAERIAVGIDAREGRVAIRGWRDQSPERAADVAARVVAAGVRTVIYTDIGRDGMLDGPDIDGALELQRTGAAVIASGGVASLADIRAVRAAGLAGAIVGRAIYEGRVTVEEALAAVTGER